MIHLFVEVEKSARVSLSLVEHAATAQLSCTATWVLQPRQKEELGRWAWGRAGRLGSRQQSVWLWLVWNCSFFSLAFAWWGLELLICLSV